MSDCIFCKIANKEIGSLIYEDEKVCAFKDLNPQAPVHVLVIPKKHIPTLNETREDDLLLLGHMVKTASDLAKEMNIEKSGYRLVMNCNEDAGQTVFHVHLHILGGTKLKTGLG